MSDSALVRSVQQILSSLRRDAALPLGCSVIEPDEDDVCTWFVKLDYAVAGGRGRGGAQDERQQHVDILLSFPALNVPPTVSVLQPRLVAPFIHHGALCALDLMTTTWQLTKESVTDLLMAVHRSLDVGDPLSGVTLDAASGHYSAEERKRGQALLERAHAHEFGALQSSAEATATASTAALTVPPPVVLANAAALAAHLQEVLGSHNVAVCTDDDAVVVTASDESFLLPPLHVVGPAERPLTLRIEVEDAVVGATTAVSLQNVHLDARKFVVFGSMHLTKCKLTDVQQLLVQGRGTFSGEDCVVVQGSASSSGGGDSLLVAQHMATVNLHRSTLTCGQKKDDEDAFNRTKKPLVQVLNTAVLHLEDCQILAPFRHTALEALTDSTVSLQRCVVRAKESALIAIGATVHAADCTFTGSVSGEHQSVLHVSRCVLEEAKYGFCITRSSRLTLEECTARRTHVGCLVDGALATVHKCSFAGTYAGLHVRNKSKCTVTKLSVQPMEDKTLRFGVAVENATLTIQDSDIRNAHFIGLLVSTGGSVQAEDVRIDSSTQPTTEVSLGVKLQQAGVCSVRRSSASAFRYGFFAQQCVEGAITFEDCQSNSFIGFLLLGCPVSSVLRCKARSCESGLCLLQKTHCIARQFTVQPLEGTILSYGVVVDDARLVLEDSDIRRARLVGMLVRGEGALEELDVRVHP